MANYTMRDFRTFRYLEELAAESNPQDLIDTIDLETLLDEAGKPDSPKKKSNAFPPLSLNPDIHAFACIFDK